MKKLNVLMMACVIGLVTVSCTKKDEVMNPQKVVHTATAQRISIGKTDPNSGSNPDHSDPNAAAYSLAASHGHKASTCSNSCTTAGGVNCHVPCQGWGSTCDLKATVSVSKESAGNDYEAVTLDDYGPTDGPTYNMPARSFYVEDKVYENGYTWMNIPEQTLVRESKSNSFKFQNISFSSEPLFNNL